MRLVLDTNVVIAGLLWHGPPRQILDLAIEQAFTLYSSPALIEELINTLRYEKFSKRIARYGFSIEARVSQYQTLVDLVSPIHIPRVISKDPDDDHVLACAYAARADWIVSGDRHLLDLETHQNIPILGPTEALQRLLQR